MDSGVLINEAPSEGDWAEVAVEGPRNAHYLTKQTSSYLHELASVTGLPIEPGRLQAVAVGFLDHLWVTLLEQLDQRVEVENVPFDVSLDCHQSP